MGDPRAAKVQKFIQMQIGGLKDAERGNLAERAGYIPLQFGPSLKFKIPTKWLPVILGGVGGGVGLAGGPAGAVGGAALGGGAGEAAAQLINRAQGTETPATSKAAALQITKEGLKQGAYQAAGGAAGELVGKGAPALKNVAERFYGRPLGMVKLGASRGTGAVINETVPEMMARGEIAGTRAGLEAQSEASLAKAEGAFNKAIADLEKGGKMPDKKPILDALDAYKESFMHPTPKEIPIEPQPTGLVTPSGQPIMHPPGVRYEVTPMPGNESVPQFIDELKEAVDRTDNVADLNKVRQKFDAFVRNNKPINYGVETGIRTEREANRAAAHATRKAIAEANPDLAQANKELHYQLNKSQLLEEAKRRMAGRGVSILRPTAGMIAGGYEAPNNRAKGALIGALLGAAAGNTGAEMGGGLLLNYLAKLLASPGVGQALANAGRLVGP